MQPIIKQPARKELVSKGLTFNEPARKELVSKELTLKELAFSELTLNLPEDSVEKVQNLITLGMENQLNIELAEYRIQLASQLYPKLSTYDMYLYRCAFPNTITSIHK